MSDQVRSRRSVRRCVVDAGPRRDWLDVVLLVAERAAESTGGTVTVLLPGGRRLVFEPERGPATRKG
jgi:hypothetical protein